jgi:hypothetical protein
MGYSYLPIIKVKFKNFNPSSAIHWGAAPRGAVVDNYLFIDIISDNIYNI